MPDWSAISALKPRNPTKKQLQWCKYRSLTNVLWCSLLKSFYAPEVHYILFSLMICPTYVSHILHICRFGSGVESSNTFEFEPLPGHRIYDPRRVAQNSSKHNIRSIWTTRITPFRNIGSDSPNPRFRSRVHTGGTRVAHGLHTGWGKLGFSWNTLGLSHKPEVL